MSGWPGGRSCGTRTAGLASTEWASCGEKARLKLDGRPKGNARQLGRARWAVGIYTRTAKVAKG